MMEGQIQKDCISSDVVVDAGWSCFLLSLPDLLL
jgi:hypothetical protein